MVFSAKNVVELNLEVGLQANFGQYEIPKIVNPFTRN